jgi:uncharacterized repeat protein (TIGR01451 family)
MTTYAWSILSGGASISGATNLQSVTVNSPSGCNTSYVLSLTITDANGCLSTCTQTVLVQDVTTPVVTCPTGVPASVNVNSGVTYVHSGNSWDATATDDCSAVTLTATLTGATTLPGLATLAGTSFNIGTTHVIWTATDACSNSNSNCSFDVVVLGTADLKITKTGPATAFVGSSLNYTITVDNLGPAPAPAVTVSDAVPAGLTNPEFSTDGGASWASWTGSYGLPFALSVSGQTTILIRGIPDCSTIGNLSNTATVALSPITDPDLTNNSSTWGTTITDNLPPTFTPPSMAAVYCVENIYEGIYLHDPVEPDNPNDDDLTHQRPDYYLFEQGSTILNITAFSDNCALAANPISWSIDFRNNGSVDLSGTGQLQDYIAPLLVFPDRPVHGIKFPVGTNKITFRLTDLAGQYYEQTVFLVVEPRPVIIKNF